MEAAEGLDEYEVAPVHGPVFSVRPAGDPVRFGLVAAGVLSFVSLDERLTPRQWIGVGLAVIALILVESGSGDT